MLAFGIYIIGIAIVLYSRPALMFKEKEWKEFGLSGSGNYTLFPFWMFTLLWAVFSYALATMATVFFANLAVRPGTPRPDPVMTPVSSLQPTTPGYYIVEPNGEEAARYIYLGTKPPTARNMNLRTNSR